MKIEKFIGNKKWFFYYYIDSKTNNKIFHGLSNIPSYDGIGYFYHNEMKGFWLRNNL